MYAIRSYYEYYLAAQANEVFLDPEGGILLEGLGRYRLYYRQALQDKLVITSYSIHYTKLYEMNLPERLAKCDRKMR